MDADLIREVGFEPQEGSVAFLYEPPAMNDLEGCVAGVGR